MVHRSIHDHLPDRQVPQEEPARQNDAHNANRSQCFRYNRSDNRSDGFILRYHGWH